MTRLMLLGAILTQAACTAAPGSVSGRLPVPLGMPMSVETSPNAAPHRASDAPSMSPFSGGFRLPSLRRGSGPSDDRPSWLRDMPENPERYPVPREWYRDRIAGLDTHRRDTPGIMR